MNTGKKQRKLWKKQKREEKLVRQILNQQDNAVVSVEPVSANRGMEL